MSNYLVETIVAVVSTTVDDFVVQIYFLSKIMKEGKTDSEKFGLYLQAFAGVMIAYTIINLLACSFLILGAFVSEEYIALLGFIPLLMGLWQIHEGCEDKGIYEMICCSTCCSSSDDNDKKGEKLSFSGAGGIGTLSEKGKPILTATGHSRKKKGSRRSSVTMSATRRIGYYASGKFGSHNNSCDNSRNESDIPVVNDKEYSFEDLMRESRENNNNYGTNNSNNNDNEEEEEEEEEEGLEHPLDAGELENNCCANLFSCLGPIMTPFMLEVLLVTLAVSSDNIIVYAAMFTTMPTIWVFISLAIIMTLVMLLFVIALWTSRIDTVNRLCTDYSGYLVPPLLIGLGLYILSGSVVWP